MKTRAITGLFFVLIMLASVLLGGFTYSIFFLLLSAASVFEFYKLIKTDTSLKPLSFMGILFSVVLFAAIIAYQQFGYSLILLLLAVPFLMLIYLCELYRKSENPFHNIAHTLMGVIYALLPFAFFYSLAYLEGIYNAHYPLAFLIMLWCNDTGAYLVGRSFGKRKLFERHSPKKTWEGFFGGVLISLVSAAIISFYFHELSLIEWGCMALIISVFGTLGDLTESMLKRSFGVKDSGNILPGHGGLLDRFDGLLMAAPLVYTFLYIVIVFSWK
ncbi:phosphatidate cytidylyltransferase [Olivibacter sitiensis]|uniref:phosphatidate cytidylyltransferase n=1 Tax=Olivibacter sitiensis TaxID=376470 RepID=UPI000405F0D2|nr:phosphatidate cytidylyltransferase [Olivibacter sitiensis]